MMRSTPLWLSSPRFCPLLFGLGAAIDAPDCAPACPRDGSASVKQRATAIRIPFMFIAFQRDGSPLYTRKRCRTGQYGAQGKYLGAVAVAAWQSKAATEQVRSSR